LLRHVLIDPEREKFDLTLSYISAKQFKELIPAYNAAGWEKVELRCSGAGWVYSFTPGPALASRLATLITPTKSQVQATTFYLEDEACRAIKP
jgi:hypothetical protein